MWEPDINKLQAAAYRDGLNDALRIIDKYKEQLDQTLYEDTLQVIVCDELIQLIEAKTQGLLD